MKSVLSAAAAVSAGILACGCVVVDSQGHINREEKRFAVTGAPEVHLTTYDGPIEIHAGEDAKSVIVEIEKRGPTKEALDTVRIDTKQEGNRVPRWHAPKSQGAGMMKVVENHARSLPIRECSKFSRTSSGANLGRSRR